MRIDYSEPKKSYSSQQSTQHRPRKESSGGVLVAVLISGLVCLVIGFGSGWMLSQRAAKKGFKAALEQQSLETTPQQPKNPPTAQQTTATSPQQQPGTAQQPATPGNNQSSQSPTEVPQTAGNTQLSFYKTLPSGQKNTVLGSGINTKEDKPAKQPLQAVMPANLSKPPATANDDTVQKAPAQTAPSKTTRPDANGFTVQVASYSLKSEAETMRSSLAAKGYNVTIVESRLGDKGTWYRVRIGKRLDPEAAKELAKKLGKGAIPIPDKD